MARREKMSGSCVKAWWANNKGERARWGSLFEIFRGRDE